MATPIRFLRRIARRPADERRDLLNSKNAKVLISVAQHHGIAAKTKAQAVDGLLKAAQKVKK
jgi:hypothetical protein